MYGDLYEDIYLTAVSEKTALWQPLLICCSW